MIEEKIIKKEDNLDCKIGLLGRRGSLVLTIVELYFISKEAKVLSIPLKNIISVNAKKGLGNGIDHLFIIFNENDQERKIKIQHLAFWAGMAMGNMTQLREPYFRSWEAAIEDARFDRGHKNSFNNIEKLADLRTKGILTEEEFQKKKKEILETY